MTPESIVEFAEGLARIAASGGGPKALATHLARHTGGGVLLEDTKWRHLAAAGSGPIPASGRAIVQSGETNKAHRVSAGDTHFGWLSLYGVNGSVDAGVLVRLTAAAIAVELARGVGVVRARTLDFWEGLLDNRFHDSAAARDEAATHGITLAPSYLAVALEADVAPSAKAEPNELRAPALEAFRSIEGQVGIVERGGVLLMFVPVARAVDASNARTAAGLLPKSVCRRTPGLVVSGGIGRVEPLTGIAQSAAAALSALAIGRRMYGSGHIAAYDELGAYTLLHGGADVAGLRAFASEALAPLRRYDEKHQTELERTLKHYFMAGQNVKTAAEALNVHRHTVFYRLRQIAEICARTFENPHDQLTLRLAVAIDELHDAS